MKGFIANEMGHLVLGLAPQGTSNSVALTSDTFLMEGWQHASIIIMGGVGSTATSVTVGECTSFAGSDRTAVTFRYAKTATKDADTMSTALAVASSLALTGTAGVMAVIELDADELTDGYPYVQVNTAISASKDLAILVVLSGGRYQEDITATAIV
jgi:hypothetical protein